MVSNEIHCVIIEHNMYNRTTFETLEKIRMIIDEKNKTISTTQQQGLRRQENQEVLLEERGHEQEINQILLQVDGNGQTPLHISMMLDEKIPVEIVKRLCILKPEAATAIDKDGRTPFHIGVLAGAPMENIKTTYRIYPQATEKQDFFNRTPLHDYLYQKKPNKKEIVEFLLHCHPKVLEMRDINGCTPLHLCVENTSLTTSSSSTTKGTPSISEEICHTILQKFRMAAMMVNNHGQTPLHIAVRKRVSVDIIKAIFQAYPTAVHIMDCQGNTPLQVARHQQEQQRQQQKTNISDSRNEECANNDGGIIMSILEEENEMDQTETSSTTSSLSTSMSECDWKDQNNYCYYDNSNCDIKKKRDKRNRTSKENLSVEYYDATTMTRNNTSRNRKKLATCQCFSIPIFWSS